VTRFYWIGSLVLVAVAAGAAAALYPFMPDRIPTHWNIRGEVDGYGAKQWALFLVPAMMAGFLVLFYFLPALSPKHFEVTTFRSTYLYIMLIVTGLFFYIHAITMYASWRVAVDGAKYDLGRPLIAGMFLFFAVLGNVLGKVRKNFYIGVRVPWTLASDRVWNDTHRLAAWLMVGAGLVGFVLTLIGLSPIVAFVLLMFAAIIPIVYSFVHYKSLERRGALGD
jgi:uncharacterized membrane protein